MGDVHIAANGSDRAKAAWFRRFPDDNGNGFMIESLRVWNYSTGCILALQRKKKLEKNRDA